MFDETLITRISYPPVPFSLGARHGGVGRNHLHCHLDELTFRLGGSAGDQRRKGDQRTKHPQRISGGCLRSDVLAYGLVPMWSQTRFESSISLL